jgi:hypothetical protein
VTAEIDADEIELRLEPSVDTTPLPAAGSEPWSEFVSLFGPRPAARRAREEAVRAPTRKLRKVP